MTAVDSDVVVTAVYFAAVVVRAVDLAAVVTAVVFVVVVGVLTNSFV